MRIRRKVTGIENYINPHANGTQGSNVLTLECGHTTSRKGSIKIPEMVYCRECEDWANGKTSFKRMGNIIETWDIERQLPVFTEIRTDE